MSGCTVNRLESPEQQLNWADANRVAVICTTLGSCWNLGMGLACACDIRISASSVRFVVQEVDIASNSDSATLRLLPKLVGNSSWIRDVVFSAREFGADEALRVGFVSNVLETKEEALCEGLKLAEAIAAKGPIFTQRSKQALWRIRNIRASKHSIFLCLSGFLLNSPAFAYDDAGIQPGLEWNHDYPEAELAADLDQALGVESLKRAPKLQKL